MTRIFVTFGGLRAAGGADVVSGFVRDAVK